LYELPVRRSPLAFDGYRNSSCQLCTSGNVYVTDPRNRVVRKIRADGQMSTLVGQRWNKGFAAGPLPGFIDEPAGVAVHGATLYISTSNAVAAVKLP
jgi:hypothetical protein